MPYIAISERPQYQNEIDSLTEKLIQNNHPGHINYVFSKILKNIVLNDFNYRKINEIFGVLECVKQEFYRKTVSNYEDSKIADPNSGDI